MNDDSLLNVEKKVPGENLFLSDVTTERLNNTPGIYAIRCIPTNKHYVGETKNIKNRIPKLIHDLESRKGNSKFVSEYVEHQSSSFELILYETGESCNDFQYRKFIEYKLQSELSAINCCYNSGTSETIGERPSGDYPTSPGIYCIRCKINGACYIGETDQRRGLAGRLSSWKSRLINNQAKNQILQHDWFRYNENQFEFLIIHWGTEWLDSRKRKNREKELIKQYRENNIILYNSFSEDHQRAPSCPLAAREICIRNQSQEYRDYIAQLNTGRVSGFRKPIQAEGNIYFSIQEASECLGITRSSIRRQLGSNFKLATYEEIVAEKERRNVQQTGPVKKERHKKRPGLSQKIYAKGGTYNSMSEAARALGVSVAAVSKSIQIGREGYYRINSEEKKDS